MSSLTRHVVIPLLAPLSVVVLYLTPVSVIGCAPRGLLALAIVFTSLGCGVLCGVQGLRSQVRRAGGSGRWIASMCILAVPALLVLGPLG